LIAKSPNKNITKNSNYIWAYGSSSVISGIVPRHAVYGSISIDFTTMNSTSTNNLNDIPLFNIKNSSLIHGILMTTSWTIIPFSAIFIARYLKNIMGKWWYYTHLYLMLLATIISTIGILFIILTSTPPHFSNPHKIIGFVILIDSIIQVVSGFISNHLWFTERKFVPWWDKLHWWNGRILFILALANVYLGLLLMESVSTLFIIFFVSIGILVVVLIVGQFFIRKKNK
jgi:hypothetical protein